MQCKISVALDYAVPLPCALLLQILPAEDSEQTLSDVKLALPAGHNPRYVPGEDGIGQRIWLETTTRFQCHFDATVTVERPAAQIAGLPAPALSQLTGNAVTYLMSSRYCHADAFGTFLKQFAPMSGGDLVLALAAWCKNELTYDIAASTSVTTAQDTFQTRRGVCRDYAHLLIALCRSSAIPARIASVYAPEVTPPDFHAVAEVYLDGCWHLIDSTGMAKAEDIVRIGVGRDAADVAFLTSFGDVALNYQSVEVVRVQGTTTPV